MAILCFKFRDGDRTDCHNNNLLYHTKITKIIIIFSVEEGHMFVEQLANYDVLYCV